MVRFGTVRCGAVWCGAVRCGGVQCGAVRRGAVQYSRVRCSVAWKTRRLCMIRALRGSTTCCCRTVVCTWSARRVDGWGRRVGGRSHFHKKCFFLRDIPFFLAPQKFRMRTEETTGNVFDEFSLLDRYMVHDYRYTGRGMRTPTGGEGHRQVGAGSNIRTKLLDAIRWRFGRFPSPEAFPLTGLETRKNYG